MLHQCNDHKAFNEWFGQYRAVLLHENSLKSWIFKKKLEEKKVPCLMYKKLRKSSSQQQQ